MGQTNASSQNLELGRGRKPKLNNQTVSMRMSPSTKAFLEDLAVSYGCLYGGSAWIAGLLEKIGRQELIVVPAPPVIPESSPQLSDLDPREAVKAKIRDRHCPSTKNNSEGCEVTNSASSAEIVAF
jgi:hypothetical protein